MTIKKYTVQMTVEVEVEDRWYPGATLPTLEQIMQAYLRFSGGSLVSYKDLAENGYLDFPIDMEVSKWVEVPHGAE